MFLQVFPLPCPRVLGPLNSCPTFGVCFAACWQGFYKPSCASVKAHCGCIGPSRAAFRLGTSTSTTSQLLWPISVCNGNTVPRIVADIRKGRVFCACSESGIQFCARLCGRELLGSCLFLFLVATTCHVFLHCRCSRVSVSVYGGHLDLGDSVAIRSRGPL